MYHVDPDHKEREFLTEEELDIFAGIELENPNFAFARDLFMFGCRTIPNRKLISHTIKELFGWQRKAA
jgi:hypothetical protein